jgi:DNA-binding protein
MAEEKTQDTKATKESQKQRKSDENVVFIGNKPFMNYVTGVVMQFTTKGSKEVVVKARGKFISRAVDVAEVATKRFLEEHDVDVKAIKIDSEEFENKEGKKVNVSTIEITLGKK